MTFWIYFWTLLFFISLSLFAVMAVWVTIGGWKDIRTLFRDLANRQDDDV